MFPLWPLAALLASLVSLSIGTSFAKHLFPAVGAEGTTLYRIVFAPLILMALWRPWRQRWSRQDIGPLVLFGLTLGAMNLLFYSALKTIPFGLAIAIEFTGPLAVALWTSRRPTDWRWVALAVLGLGLILPWRGLDAPGALDPVGMGFALAAGACWAVYIVLGQRVARKHGVLATPMGMLAAAVLVVPIGVTHAGAALLDSRWLLAGVAVAVLSSAIPYTLEMYALRHLPKRSFSVLLSLEPAVGAVAGWIVLGERLGALQWLAMGFIMAASMGAAWSAGRGSGET
ncbi:MAG: EamA family transporter [Limnohabitans sp.]